MKKKLARKIRKRNKIERRRAKHFTCLIDLLHEDATIKSVFVVNGDGRIDDTVAIQAVLDMRNAHNALIIPFPKRGK